MIYPVDRMSKQDIFFLKTFNFYNKKIDFGQLKENEIKVFHVEKTKTPESTIDNDNSVFTNLLNSLEEIRDFNNMLLKQLEFSVMTTLYVMSHIKIDN
jgi:hypothetical protein